MNDNKKHIIRAEYVFCMSSLRNLVAYIFHVRFVCINA
jgi:hypothetical protein